MSSDYTNRNNAYLNFWQKHLDNVRLIGSKEKPFVLWKNKYILPIKIYNFKVSFVRSLDEREAIFVLSLSKMNRDVEKILSWLKNANTREVYGLYSEHRKLFYQGYIVQIGDQNKNKTPYWIEENYNTFTLDVATDIQNLFKDENLILK
ncbi:hypothetical protein [Aquimarina algiphila]|uniref:Uncharacterized protein n=1 Tax=Aquimarina algiphila TaxID=2047982 RepID=A0A554VRP6_9FLAO|nr:hypothetical protein [Aquimarina algiphila]TSE11333.1 hypothetical protein FOF46_01505 [Aquimarina algiphila]